MPCKGCVEKKYDMRFVGWKDGKLIKTAPSGLKQGQIQKNFLHMADQPYWELADKVPDLVIPEGKYEDSVFIEEIFVPEDEPVDEAPEEDT